jgi:hypothetical protein
MKLFNYSSNSLLTRYDRPYLVSVNLLQDKTRKEERILWRISLTVSQLIVYEIDPKLRKWGRPSAKG